MCPVRSVTYVSGRSPRTGPAVSGDRMSANHRRASRQPLMPPPTTSMSSTQGVVLLLEHALRIHLVDPVSALLAGLHRAAHFNRADIVVQYVDPA
jgi:hypothetical protein